MRKQVFGRKFKRDKNERKALFSGLISAMVLRGRIETTEQKAKAVRPDLEKLVTKAKKGESSRKLLTASLKNWEIDRMINDIAPKFKDRPGGYTRILKTGRRFNDDASMVIMEWVEGIAAPVKAEQPKKDSKPKKETKAEKKPAKKTAKKEASSRENK